MSLTAPFGERPALYASVAAAVALLALNLVADCVLNKTRSSRRVCARARSLEKPSGPLSGRTIGGSVTPGETWPKQTVACLFMRGSAGFLRLASAERGARPSCGGRAFSRGPARPFRHSSRTVRQCPDARDKSSARSLPDRSCAWLTCFCWPGQGEPWTRRTRAPAGARRRDRSTMVELVPIAGAYQLKGNH